MKADILIDFQNFISVPLMLNLRRKTFISTHNLTNLEKQKNCFKNPENPSCIDRILTNSPRNFQKSSVFETRLSDFHKLTTTVLKQYSTELKVANYREYRKFCNDEFRAEFNSQIVKHDKNNME